MIDSFIDSWELFGDMYLAGMGCSVLLSIIGIYFVARNQIFAGASIAQASTLGIAISILNHQHSYFMPILFAVISCLIMITGDRHLLKKGSERLTGWIFLFCMSLSVLLVTHSPHGLEEVKNLISTGLIQATKEDAILFWTSSAVVILLVIIFYKKLILFTIDIDMARSVGLKITTWMIGISLVIGWSLGTTIHSTGMLFSFSCLILPAMIARNICKKTRSIFIVSPTIALCTVLVSFVVANHFDTSLDQTASMCLCLLLPISLISKHHSFYKIF